MGQLEVALSVTEPLLAVDVWLVLDLLRASTMIVAWFERGGKAIYPEISVENALALKAKMTGTGSGRAPLLMGERNAIPPEGFDIGNSPFEITEELTKQNPVAIMATSNGTKALLKAISTGAAVYVACARNALYALDMALSQGSHIGILCAGRAGRPGIDDAVCAGMMAERLCRLTPNVVMSDGANIARALWKNAGGDLLSGVRVSDHARLLEKIGFGADIAYSCEQDVTACVPELKEIADDDGKGLRAVLTHERKGGLRFFSPDIVAGILEEEPHKIEKIEQIEKVEIIEPAPIVEDNIFMGDVLEGAKKRPRKSLDFDFGG